MNKKTRNLIVGVIVVAVLGGGYAGLRAVNAHREKAKMEQATKTNPSLVSIAEADITSITFPGTDGEMTFTQNNGKWSDTNQPDFAVSDSKMKILTNDLKEITYTREITKNEDLSTYGLDQPSDITVKQTDGTETVIHVGEVNESQGETYIMVDEQKAVYTTTSSLKTDFSGTLIDFASYTEFPDIVASQMSQVEVQKSEDASYSLQMTGDYDCTVTDSEGDTQLANLSALGSIQENVANIVWRNHYEYNCTDFAKYGLDQPVATITVQWKDDKEQAQSVKLAVGGTNDVGDYYVRMNDNTQVHSVAADRLMDLVDGSAQSLWSLCYSFVSIGDLDHLEVTYKGATYNMKRVAGDGTDEDTYFVDDKQVKSREAFTNFYYNCVSVTAQERVETVPKHEEDPKLELHYFLIDGTEKVIKYYEYDANFYEVLYENDTKAGHTNKLTVNLIFDSLEKLLEEMG